LFSKGRAREAVANNREVVPHGRRQAVKVDLVDLGDRLWGIRCRSGVPDVRGRSDDGEKDIYAACCRSEVTVGHREQLFDAPSPTLIRPKHPFTTLLVKRKEFARLI